jgi:flagellar export protein FliJ
MKPFPFRLDRLLRLRTQSERAQAGVLAQASRQQEQQRAAFDAASARLEQASQQLAPRPGAVHPAGTLHHLGLTVAVVSEAVQRAAVALREADAQLASARASFQQARQDRRTVERLRELQEAAWQTAAARSEQREHDDAAAARHARRGPR